ncbi:MAG: DUF1697 domain-containing protein [Acidimicrobiales bacterium]|nr:DUF1697 domain-containing protein [Acidimicrobiales bacterium]
MSGGRYVAFLRAINVGKRRVAMDDLLAAVEPVGLDGAWTHIASGNLVFGSDRSPAELEPAIEAALVDALGFEAEAFVRPTGRVDELVAATPFAPTGDATTHLVVFVRSPLDPPRAAAVEALSGDVDKLVVDGAELHWRIRGKSMDTALAPRDWRATDIGPTTSRNITMLTKLAARLAG